MKPWDNILKGVLLIIGIIIIAFNVLLYNFCEQQKVELSSIKDKQDVESEFNSNKFKYQEDQIERLNKDLEDAQQQIKGQNDALLQEIEKGQQIENDSKGVQNSLVDIKAEADAIKQDMKGWQKDYVSVLAEIEKKMDDSQNETKSLEDNFTALNIPELKENINSLKADIEKVTHPPDNSLSNTLPTSDNKVDNSQLGSQ